MGQSAGAAGGLAGCGGLSELHRHQELPDDGELGPAASIGEEAIVADAVEAVGQAVQQEATDELLRIERHQPGRVAVTIIAPTEGYAGLVGADQATVGDGDPVGIAAEIGEHLLGRAKRRLGIDDPVLATKLPDRGREGMDRASPSSVPEKRSRPAA